MYVDRLSVGYNFTKSEQSFGRQNTRLMAPIVHMIHHKEVDRGYIINIINLV